MATRSSDFVTHSCDYWPNWTPLSPITIKILLKLWLIGNRTSCRPIRSVIILAIKQMGLSLRGRPILLTTRTITDRIGLHSVLLPL